MKDLTNARIMGGHKVVFHDGADFIVVYTRYNVYQGFYLNMDHYPYTVNIKKTPKPQDNHFETLKDCLKYFKVGS